MAQIVWTRIPGSSEIFHVYAYHNIICLFRGKLYLAEEKT